ncbi:DUF2939 domain-containing protein [Acinetobacter larvae]|uniref:DUF2939 domain-containing protein n=1 Tax=Acinetobacter larvae TaxID=1789224 RepID=A0A1B2LVR0_9GAMM|nr:DUF2939 domain-containing protein [Acinetobacter larvae]AOA57018.1 hypothetical protein BFG52_00695 [Acinetobacter larvae]
MKSKTAIRSLLALIILGAAYLYASPYWVLYQIKNAVDQNDQHKLSQYIDYPSVRQNLKQQLQSQIAAQLQQPDQGVYAELGMKFASVFTEKMLDQMIRPETLALLLQTKAQAKALQHPNTQQSTTQPTASTETPTAPNSTASDLAYHTAYQSFSRFRVSVANTAQATTQIDIVLKRHGLSWQVSEIILPNGIKF